MIAKFLGSLVGVLVFIKLYLVHTSKRCQNSVCLSGRTVLITGANTGIGYHAAEEFAKRGARVILACRDREKAEKARREITKNTQNENVIFRYLDLSSLESVKKCAREILDTENRLDILVNNAGVAGIKNKKTDDGLQIVMQINYFAHVLLTVMLLDLLKKSPAARIINVSSLLARKGKLDLKVLDKYCGIYQTYNNSKLCNVLFTKYLAHSILKGTNISTFSLHPGAINTEIFRKFQGLRKTVFKIVAGAYFKTPPEGAQTIIYTATQPGLERYTGCHFEECDLVPDYESAKGLQLVEEVWKKTCDILDIKVSYL